jgi:elongation factor Ts
MEFSAKDVAKLRELTGAGFADCKAALADATTLEDAVKRLEEKGATRAEKVKGQDRETRQGLIHSYIHHGGNVGALLELNCSTDFVARSDEFRNLARELTMQIAGVNPQYISRSDIPGETLEQLRQDAGSDAELERKLGEIVLLEQPWIKDAKVKVSSLVDDVIRKTGENIVVRRFTRYALGE